ncbi:Helix-turn-helix domain containing protein [uncultured Caudovirales phage]|uniref:Helix-turn-helix domain containing protein n=1 Tax=uncultured Caudovirales phage TaxID=2100421 RepID=A0A6J5L9V0_9CAUD|nr:Helix-turn-helix domain containing protein [uncultured Caudovirales phage]
MRLQSSGIGRRIRDRRRRLNLSCRSLAARAGTACSTIWKIENGQIVHSSPQMIDRIEQALDHATSLAIHRKPKPIGSDTMTIDGQEVTLVTPDETWTDTDWRDLHQTLEAFKARLTARHACKQSA